MDQQNCIRVLFPYQDGDAIGGSHTSSLTLAAGLDRREFSPLVLLHGAPGVLGDMVAEMDLPILRMERPPVMAGRLMRNADNASLQGYLRRSLPALVRLLRKERIDIVHTNDGGMHAAGATCKTRRSAFHLAPSPGPGRQGRESRRATFRRSYLFCLGVLTTFKASS